MINGLNHLTLAVSNIENSVRFYRDTLGFQLLVKWHKGAYFLAGDLWFCLLEEQGDQSPSNYTHIAFTVETEDFSKLSKTIINSGATVFKENNSPGESFYFLDPDGYKLEIHSGNWQSRLQAKKHDPGSWQNIEWHI